MEHYYYYIILAALVFGGFFYFVTPKTLTLWFRAVFSGALINPIWLARMRLQKVDPEKVIDPLIFVAQAGLEIPTYKIVQHILLDGHAKEVVQGIVKANQAGIELNFESVAKTDLSGGNITKIIGAIIKLKMAGIEPDFSRSAEVDLAGGDINRAVSAYIAAIKAQIHEKFKLTFDRIVAIQLSGVDSLEAVQNYVNPKVIKTEKVRSVAQDGIELLTTARVTVKTNFERIIGGATEETILGLVGEGINKAIASSKSHRDVLAEPDTISKAILKDVQRPETLSKLAYDIESVDIADIDVGRSIGEVQKTEKAKADREQAIARAEIAKHTILERRADLMEAEAQIPKAIAEAIHQGKMNLIDYYKMKNIKADILMRKAIASASKKHDDDEEGLNE